MFHIYDRNPLVCVIPSVTIAALFGEFVFSLVSLVRLHLSLDCDLVAVGCGLTNQLRDLATPHGKTALSGWVAACFSLTLLQVPMNLFNIQEKILTRKFLDSVTAFS